MVLILITTLFVGTIETVLAYQKTASLTDKEIIERLTRLEEGQKGLNKRFDDVNKRFDDVNKRIDMLANLMYVIIAGIFGLIGFVVWDRKTAMKPVREDISKVESKVDRFLAVLRALAEEDKRVAEILKRFNLL